MKPFHLFVSLFCLLGLMACTPSGMSIGIGAGSGGHFGIGTSLNFPLGNQAHNRGLNNSETQIVAYFDTHFKAQKNSVSGGYYRELLAKRPGNLYLVQDFYANNHRKRTDPMLLQKNQLMDFYAHPSDGSHSIYHPSGILATQTQYQDGKAVRSESWPDR